MVVQGSAAGAAMTQFIEVGAADDGLVHFSLGLETGVMRQRIAAWTLTPDAADSHCAEIKTAAASARARAEGGGTA